jgi:hypothetical protein
VFRLAVILPPGPAATALVREAHPICRALSWRHLDLLVLGAAATRAHRRTRTAAWYRRQVAQGRRRAARGCYR